MNALSIVASGTALALRRFPLSAFFCLIFYLIVTGWIPKTEYTALYLSISFYGYFWFIAVKLFVESRGWAENRYYIVGIPFFLAIVLHLFNSSIESIVFLVTGLFLSIFIAPFLRKEATGAQLWCFDHDLWIHIGFTILAALILFLGIIVIIGSLDFLFGVKFYDKIYLDVWLIIAILFSPVFAMAGIPSRFDTSKDDYPRNIRVITAYIILPLLFIYTLILYGYIAKIIITWDLPKGGVAYLVSAYGIAGLLAYLVSYPLHQTLAIISLFGKYFFKTLWPTLVLLAIGLGVRVSEYGITEARYAILLCLIWLILSTIFVLTKGREQSPKFISVSVVTLLIAASFGPWSAVNVSAWSQVHRLENILEDNHMLENGQIQKPTGVISRNDRIAISSIVDYIVNTEKNSRIAPWFSNQPEAHIHQKLDRHIAKVVVEDMGIDYVMSYNRSEGEDSYNFSFGNGWRDLTLVNISGYDYLINVGDNPIAKSGFTKDAVLDKDGATVKLSVNFEPNSNHYIVHLSDINEPIIFKLGDLVKQLDKDKAGIATTNDPRLILDKKVQNVTLRLIINRINGKFISGSEKPEIAFIETALLVKLK